MNDRERLLDLLVEYSYRYSDEPIYALASGRKSNFYIDCRQTTMRREAAGLIAAVFEPLIPESAQAVGGLTAGADPIAYAIRDLAQKPLDAFMVRKERKGHGLGRQVEGPIGPGMQVAIVDDVVTSGGSAIHAIKAARAEKLNVVAVIVLVDREEDGGLSRIHEEAGPGVPVERIFTRQQIHERWKAQQDNGRGSAEDPSGAAGPNRSARSGTR